MVDEVTIGSTQLKTKQNKINIIILIKRSHLNLIAVTFSIFSARILNKQNKTLNDEKADIKGVHRAASLKNGLLLKFEHESLHDGDMSADNEENLKI